ncbi:MAG TPA: VWA domain-containing protein [Thermoanaerobaculia bacterium]|nr:VWA domain-containing protein [Thermoanaerobaculia bacterium]
MSRARLMIALLAAACCWPLQAQYTENIEVRVTNVDVVVTDRAGKPVAGLTQDDFEVLEDGKPQEVTNLYEVRQSSAQTTAAAHTAEAAPEPPPEQKRRHFVFFIDNYSLTFERNGVLKSLRRFLDRNLQPEDDVMVVIWDRNIDIVQSFTSDRSVIDAALEKVRKRGPHGAMLDAEKERAVDLAMQIWQANQRKREVMTRPGAPVPPPSGSQLDEVKSIAVAFSEEVRSIQLRLLDALHAMLTSMGGIEGRKVLVFAGAYLPERPGLEIFERFAARLAEKGDLSAMMEVDMNRKYVEPQAQEIAKVARHANAEGVTMYTIFAEDPVNVRDDPKKFTEYTNSATAFASLADMTGGTMLTKTSNYDVMFDTVARDVSSYYSLGYHTSDAEPGQRSIVVRTKNPAYRVRSRKSYVVKSNDERAGDEVIANIVQPQPKNDIPVTLTVGELRPEGRNQYIVPIDVTIPTAAVTLLPDGELMVGGFTVYVVAGTTSGGLSPVSKRQQSIRLPQATIDALQNKPLLFHAEVLVGKGENILSVGVVDRISNASGYARAPVVAR